MIHSGAARLLELLTNDTVEKVPTGWKRTEKWAEEARKSQDTMLKYLREGMRKGYIERQSFSVRLESGMVRRVPHYRLKS